MLENNRSLSTEYIVAYSKFCNEKNVQFCEDQGNSPHWITRVQGNIIEEKSAIENAFFGDDWNTFVSATGTDTNRFSASIVTKKRL